MEAEAVEVTEKPEEKPKLWEQWPGENVRWFGRFQEFLQMGKDRSVLGVYKLQDGKSAKTSTPESWATASRRYCWWDRAKHWDDEQRRIAELERVDARRREQERLIKLREEHRDGELELARELKIKAKEILAKPVDFVKEEGVNTDTGEVTQVIVSDHNQFRTAAALVKQYSETGRAALNMPVQKHQLELSKMSTEDLLALYDALGDSEGEEEEETEENNQEKDE